jgi:integrase
VPGLVTPTVDPYRPLHTGASVVGKNGNGEGNIRQRPDGRWEGRYHDVSGKRRSVYGKTRKEAAKKLAAKMANKASEPVETTQDATITAKEFFAEYMDAIRDRIKRRSYETSQDIIRLHLNPEFGSKRLRDLDRRSIQTMYNRKRDAGLSASRVGRIHGVLAASLNVAVKWGYIYENPCDAVSKPKIPAPEIRPFSKDEAKRFIAAASGERYEALFVLGLTSGARWGELAGLQWRDLNLDSRRMHIQRALVNGYGGHSFDTPKTNGSRRSVGLTALATDALIRHRERMRDEGHEVSGDALVFVNTLGKPLHSSNFIRRSFKPLLRRAGLPDTNWHAATRHSCTCILLLEGVNPKSVAMQMGWSSVAFMLQNYARFLPGWGDDGAMDAALADDL